MQLVPFKQNIYPTSGRVFSLEDIGELPNPYESSDLVHALVCSTDRNPCCLSNRLGEWRHNGIAVGTRVSGGDYFRTRDNNQQIHLSLRTMHSGNPPTGMFCCELPDASDVLQTKCVEIGMYSVYHNKSSYRCCRPVYTNTAYVCAHNLYHDVLCVFEKIFDTYLFFLHIFCEIWTCTHKCMLGTVL